MPDRVAPDAAVRTRQQRDQRPDPAAQAEDRVPLQPRSPPEDDLVERPAEVADDPEADADRDGVPEQPLAPVPALRRRRMIAQTAIGGSSSPTLPNTDSASGWSRSAQPSDRRTAATVADAPIETG